MEKFIQHVLQFGDLDQSEIGFVQERAIEVSFNKGDYFVEAGKVFKNVGFILEGIMRVCYYSKEGDEITKIFLEEDHLLLNTYNAPSSEYIQAVTDCKLVLFSIQQWHEISEHVKGWEYLTQKLISHTLIQKLERISPLVAQDAKTRYLEFVEKYPTLVNRIPLSYIASYLGMAPQSLSRIRRNIR